MLVRLWRVVMVVVFAVSGGIGTANAKDPGPPRKLNLTASATEGYVLMKVIATRPITFFGTSAWDSLAVKSVFLDRIFQVGNLQSDTHLTGRRSTESLLFGKLPAGDYEFSGFNSLGVGAPLAALMTSSGFRVGEKPPTFTVKAGEVANLGTLIHVPEVPMLQPDRLHFLAGTAGQATAKADLLLLTRTQDLPVRQGGGWTTEPQDEVRAVAQARSDAALTARVPPQGAAFLAGTSAGQVLERRGPGDWKRHDVGLAPILSVLRLPDGRLIAGSSHARYFLQSGDGRWVAHGIPGSDADVLHMEAGPDGSVLFVLVASETTKVMLLAPGEARDPRLVSELETPVDVRLVRFLSTPRAMYIASPASLWFSGTRITRVDLDTATVATSRLDFDFISWQHLGTEVRLARPGLRNGVTISRDGLATFQHTENTTRAAQWVSPTKAFGMTSVPGANHFTNYLESTNDGGITWERVGAPWIAGWTGKILFADEKEVLAEGRGGLFSTIDEGQSWQQVLPVPAGK